MDAEISRLEARLEQLLNVFATDRAEIAHLRQQLSQLEADNQQLRAKVDLAANRLETVLARLPEDGHDQ